MSMERQQVIAVIPAEGYGAGLAESVPQLLDAGYDRVVVANGATGEARDAFEAEVAGFARDITVVRGVDDAPEGYLRNAPFEAGAIGNSAGTALHYLSPDIRLMSSDAPAAVREALAPESVGAAVGLITGHDGHVDPFLHGPAFSPRAYAGGAAQEFVHKQVRKGYDETARGLRRLFGKLLDGYPDTTVPAEDQPTGQQVFWGQERNLMIKADALHAAGGFPHMRFHQAQVIGVQLARAGLETRTAPSVHVRRPVAENQTGLQIANLADAAKVIRRYGLGHFVTGNYAERP